MDQERAENSWRGNFHGSLRTTKATCESGVTPIQVKPPPPPPPPPALREIAFADNYAPNKYSLCILILTLRPHLSTWKMLVGAIFFPPCFNIVPHLFVRAKANFLAGSYVVRIIYSKEWIVGRNFTRSLSHQIVIHVRPNAHHPKVLPLLWLLDARLGFIPKITNQFHKQHFFCYVINSTHFIEFDVSLLCAQERAIFTLFWARLIRSMRS
jgi:hypothetical protein